MRQQKLYWLMQSGSLKRLLLKQDLPQLPQPTSLTETEYLTGRTIYPQMDPPKERLKSYTVKEVSLVLSTERSFNNQSVMDDHSRKQLFPIPQKFYPKGIELSVGDLSRKGTESVEGSNDLGENGEGDNAYGEQGEVYEQGEVVEEEEKEQTMRRPKFRKFQSQAHLPPAFLGHYVPKTEAELRMEERFINGHNRDLKLKHEQRELVERMKTYSHSKAKIIRNAMQKVQMRKAFNKSKLRKDQFDHNYQPKRKLSIQQPHIRKQSISLPTLKSKIIDTTKLNPPVDINSQQEILVPENMSRRQDAARLRETLSSIIHLSGEERSDAFLQSLLNESLSSTKFYFKQEASEEKQQFEESVKMMKTIENLFRKKGIVFDPNTLKKAILQFKRPTGELTKFPELNLISNPYYKRWGL